MKSVHIDIEDDKLDIFDNSLHIEPLEKDSSDYIEIMSAKEENNIKYSLDEVKRELGIL